MEGNSLAWRQQLLNSNHPGRSEDPLVWCVCAPLFNDCHSWLRQPCCSASFSSGSYLFAACSLITDFAVVSTALYLQSLFVFVFFFTLPSVWHICCWTLGHLHSAVINLSCRPFCVLPPSRLPPTPCCLPLFSQPSLGWHLTHRSVTPPSIPSLHTRLISSVPTPSPTQCPLRWDERGAALWLICYVKTLSRCDCSSFWVSF